MDLALSRMLLHKFLNRAPDIVPESASLIILGNMYDICISKNGKDTNHIRHISRRVHLVKNGEKCKFH